MVGVVRDIYDWKQALALGARGAAGFGSAGHYGYIVRVCNGSLAFTPPHNPRYFLLKGGSMPQRFFARTMLCITIGLLLLAMSASAWGQETRGRINVTVLDPQKAIVQEAVL